MSQAALNTRNHEEDVSSSRRSNGTRLAGIVFLLAVLWTIFSTKEYSPAQLEEFEREEHPERFGNFEQAIKKS